MKINELINNLKAEIEWGDPYEIDKDSLSLAIEGLEAIGDIRDEIEQLQIKYSNFWGNDVEAAKYRAYDECLDVIDEHVEKIEMKDDEED